MTTNIRAREVNRTVFPGFRFATRVASLALAFACVAASGRTLLGDEQDKKEPEKQPQQQSAPQQQPAQKQSEPAPPEWNVGVDVLMVAMPEERFMALLPDLQAPAKVDAAVAQILEAIKKKEMILRGYPYMTMWDGRRSVVETIQEKRYPREYITGGTDDKETIAVPSAFETRCTGVTMEVESFVRDGGEWIDLNIIPMDVELLGFDSYSPARRHTTPIKNGETKYGTDQPQFFTVKTTTSVSVRNGKRVLLGVHKVVKPEGYIEVFIARATVSPLR